jgi:hypothetical protein
VGESSTLSSAITATTSSNSVSAHQPWHGMRRKGRLDVVSRLKPSRIVISIVAIYVGGTIAARRLGYKVGGDVVVRCRDGHLYTTIWIPGVSVKSLRLGWYRWQRCPVGGHWAVVSPVRDEDLTDEEREFAAQHRDVRIP